MASLAREVRSSTRKLTALIQGNRRITAETAILLSRALKTTPEFWMNLQVAYDLYEARKALKPAA